MNACRVPRPLCLLSLALTVAACTESTGPDTPPPFAERVQQMTALLDMIPGSGLYEVPEVRAEVEADLGLSLYPDQEGTEFPPEYTGARLVRNPSTHHYELAEEAGGAPATGVRVTRYLRTGAGLVIPLAEVGHTDFTDEDFGSEASLGIERVHEGVERFSVEEQWFENQFGDGGSERYLSLAGTLGAEPATEFALRLFSQESLVLYGSVQLDLGNNGGFSTDGPGSVQMQLEYQQEVDSGRVQGWAFLSGSVGAIHAPGYGDVYLQMELSGTADEIQISGNGGVNVLMSADEGNHQRNFDLGGTLSSLSFAFTDGAPPAGLEEAIRELLAETRSAAGELGAAFGVEAVLP